MNIKYLVQIASLSLLIVSSQVAATETIKKQPPVPMSQEDIYEPFNRTMFEFNMRFNQNIGKPAAEAYKNFTPSPIRTGLENFFNNLTVPLSTINNLLQGKLEDGLSSIMRFTLNTTFGLFGFLDIATPAGIEDKKEDLGQTLYHWGLWKETHYVVLPFVGSYTVRELTGSMIDATYDPVYPYMIDTDSSGRLWIYVGGKFVEYTKIVGLIDDLKNQPDPYVFARESYLQYRTNQLFDGKITVPALDDFNFD